MKIAQALVDWQASPRARQIPRMILALLHDLDGGAHDVGRALLVSDDPFRRRNMSPSFYLLRQPRLGGFAAGERAQSRGDETAAEHKLKGLDRPKLN
jgi:hypothetical protein